MELNRILSQLEGSFPSHFPPEKRLEVFLYRRHPDWVALSSPYRPQAHLPTFHEVELSRLFHNDLS